jgi:predicted acylesterase/phospholipase RssA
VDGYVYDVSKLAAALKAALGPSAGWTINDCPTGVLIVACDANGHSWFFVKDNAKNSGVTGASSLVDAVVASSAAPTYFNFWPVTVGAQTLQMADGGAAGFANPVYRMAIEMFTYDTFDPSTTNIVSLGTGFFAPPAVLPAPKGLVATIEFATSTLVDSAEDLADQDTQRVYPATGFQKFNPALPSNIDEADLSAVPVLLQIGQAAAAQMDWQAILGTKTQFTV